MPSDSRTFIGVGLFAGLFQENAPSSRGGRVIYRLTGDIRVVSGKYPRRFQSFDAIRYAYGGNVAVLGTRCERQW